MKVKNRRFSGWRLLAVALAVSSFLLLAPLASASAHSDTDSFKYLVGSGLLCKGGPTACPDVSRAHNGDTIAISGRGTFSLHPRSVTGGGTYETSDAHNVLGEEGMWTALKLISFVSFGTSPPFPHRFVGGLALLRIHLTPEDGGPGFDAVLRITCLIGSPPPGANEGIRLRVPEVINFNQEVSGNTLFIRESE